MLMKKLSEKINLKNNLHKMSHIIPQTFSQNTSSSAASNIPSSLENKNIPTPPPQTNAQMMEKLKNVSVYKRIMPKLGIPFSDRKSQEMLKESIGTGSAHSYFQIADQFQTQSDPSYCGPTTMICVFNSLGVDPKSKWKGIWRWYFEDVIKCLNLEKTKDFGMTLEEFCIISRCNGVFTEAYRPDEDESKTEKEIERKIFVRLNENEENEKENSIYEDKNQIIKHNIHNSECKKIAKIDKHQLPSFESISIKKCNLDFFRTASYASTRRENFFLVTNTSRKALKQTGDGHFSPAAAYHEKSDNLLLLDAARFKYHSMWFTLTQVFNSFKNIDKSTNLTRGFILCSRYY